MEAETLLAFPDHEAFAIVFHANANLGRVAVERDQDVLCFGMFNRVRDCFLRDAIKMERDRIVEHPHAARRFEVAFYSAVLTGLGGEIAQGIVQTRRR